LPGRTHDKKPFDNTATTDIIKKTLAGIGDKGYQWIERHVELDEALASASPPNTSRLPRSGYGHGLARPGTSNAPHGTG
jgi:hypothetical protein